MPGETGHCAAPPAAYLYNNGSGAVTTYFRQMAVPNAPEATLQPACVTSLNAQVSQQGQMILSVICF